MSDAWKYAGTNVKAALIVLSVLYFISYPAYLVLILNVNIPDTYTYHPSAWGIYYSCRYVSIAWFSLFLSTARLFIPLAVFTMIGVRKIKGCIPFHVFLIIIVSVLDFMAVFGIGYLARTCNTPGQQCNICDDALKCCVPECYTAGNCPNTAACQFSLTTGQLYWDNTFKALLWTNCIYLVADALILICVFVIWYGMFGPSETEISIESANAFQMAATAAAAAVPPSSSTATSAPSAPPKEDMEVQSMGSSIHNRRHVQGQKRMAASAVPSLKSE